MVLVCCGVEVRVGGAEVWGVGEVGGISWDKNDGLVYSRKLSTGFECRAGFVMVLTKKLALHQLINSPHSPVPLDHPNPQPSKLARLPVLLSYLAG